MRSLDTNVLVRYLAADHPRHLALSDKVIEESREAGEPLFLSVIVVCELVWVMAQSYKRPKAQIIEHLESILGTKQFQVEQDALVRRALETWRSGRANFTDYLIGEISREAGCRDTVTFDLGLRGPAGFTVLS